MPGTKSNSYPVRGLLIGYSEAALTTNKRLLEHVALFPSRIGAISAYAETAGVGAGNGVFDVLINGTSIWTVATDRPTLLGTSTGEFANTAPNSRQVQKGDRITLIAVTIPATTGHARANLSVALEQA